VHPKNLQYGSGKSKGRRVSDSDSMSPKQLVKSSRRESRGLAKGTTSKALAYDDDEEDEDEGTPPSSDQIQRSNRLQHRLLQVPPAAGIALDISKMVNESYKCKIMEFMKCDSDNNG
jgi:hypothetical protein